MPISKLAFHCSLFAFLLVLPLVFGCSLLWDAEEVPRPSTELDLCENGEDDDQDMGDDRDDRSRDELRAVPRAELRSRASSSGGAPKSSGRAGGRSSSGGDRGRNVVAPRYLEPRPSQAPSPPPLRAKLS